jgi:tryptophan 2,3-dioxygenase
MVTTPRLTYGSYLHLDELLTAQHPVSTPPHHDELLFIVQHQTSELWLKLVLHELRGVLARLRADELRHALKGLARVKHIQHTLTDQWAVLATLTPTEYAEFRGFLGSSSGFQSDQYRAVEFVLGNKNKAMIDMFAADPRAQALLTEVLEQPSLYDEFVRYLARHGHPVPSAVLERDVTQAHEFTPELVPVFRAIYEDATPTGRSTRPARSSSTSRTTSSCGASGTSRRWSARSASSAAPAAPAA